VGGGFYQCYCNKFKDYIGFAKGKKDICTPFLKDKFWGYFLTGCSSVLTNAVNYALTMVVEWAVESIGYDTLSEKYSTIMVCTFVSSFINTGIITLLTNADFTFAPWPLSMLPINQQYTDMTTAWWLKIATSMVVTVCI
jgi:hypothetical protein